MRPGRAFTRIISMSGTRSKRWLTTLWCLSCPKRRSCESWRGSLIIRRTEMTIILSSCEKSWKQRRANKKKLMKQWSDLTKVLISSSFKSKWLSNKSRSFKNKKEFESKKNCEKKAKSCEKESSSSISEDKNLQTLPQLTRTTEGNSKQRNLGKELLW